MDYSPSTSGRERPCGEQVGSWPGVARHRRAEKRYAKSTPEWEAACLASCPLCSEANRRHAVEMYERSPRGRRAADRRARKVGA